MKNILKIFFAIIIYLSVSNVYCDVKELGGFVGFNTMDIIEKKSMDFEDKYQTKIFFKKIIANDDCYSDNNFKECIKNKYYFDGIMIGIKQSSVYEGSTITYGGEILEIVSIIDEKYKASNYESKITNLLKEVLNRGGYLDINNITDFYPKLDEALSKTCLNNKIEICDLDSILESEIKKQKEIKRNDIISLENKATILERIYKNIIYFLFLIPLILIIVVITNRIRKNIIVKKIINLIDDHTYYKMTLIDIKEKSIYIKNVLENIENHIILLTDLLADKSKNIKILVYFYDLYNNKFYKLKKEVEEYKLKNNLSKNIDVIHEINENLKLFNSRIEELKITTSSRLLDKNIIKLYVDEIERNTKNLSNYKLKLEKNILSITEEDKKVIIAKKIKDIETYINIFENIKIKLITYL